MVEHLLHASPLVAQCIANIFNMIVENQTVPAILKGGLITPIYKKKNSPKSPDNYRRITVTSVFNKVLEKVLPGPLKQILSSKFNLLQRGFTNSAFLVNTALLVSEAIAEAKDCKKHLYITYLDASKAFDVVFHNSLMNSLHGSNIVGNMGSVLNNSYQGIHSTVKWNKETSRQFQESQGVRQRGYPQQNTLK